MFIELCDRLLGIYWSLPPSTPPSTPACHIMPALPTEILQEIFLIVIHASPLDDPQCYHGPAHAHPHPPRMALLHVCKRWREIVLNYPPLWSVLTSADFCHSSWIRAILQRQQGTNPLTIRFATCSRRINNLDRDLDLMSLVQESSAKVKRLSLESADDGILDMFQPQIRTRGWAVSLEDLSITIGRPCNVPSTVESKSNAEEHGRDGYVARVNASHVPDLAFAPDIRPIFVLFGGIDGEFGGSGAPNLRRLSLTNCIIDPSDIERFPLLEELSVSHVESRCTPQYWATVIRSLPRLKRLTIDGGMHPPPLDKPGDLHDILKCLTCTAPVSELTELNLNRCSPACAVLLFSLASQPRKLQLTCTRMQLDPEFITLCAALKLWLGSWESESGDGGYLYVSVQANGIIAHNRRAERDGDEGGNDTSPTLQLTLYWEPSHAMNFISTILGLISTTSVNSHRVSRHPAEFDTNFLVRGCEELELSLGSFDYEDERFQSALSDFIARFGNVKRLRCLDGAASFLASLVGKNRLLPSLTSICFDHIDFDGTGNVNSRKVEDFFERHQVPIRLVELANCRNVSHELIPKLERLGAKVVVGQGTEFAVQKKMEESARERWSSDQVKLLMRKWTNEAQATPRVAL